MREANILSNVDKGLRLSGSEEVWHGEEVGALEAIDLEILLRLDRWPPPAASAAGSAALLPLVGRRGFVPTLLLRRRRGVPP